MLSVPSVWKHSFCQKRIFRSLPHAKFILLVALMLAGLTVSRAGMAAQTAGATSGELSVTPTGAASYNIPITVPPGVAGISPKLALVYNSQAGNGLLGVGWGLSGLSVITRCSKSYLQDGAKAGVSFSNSDKYCLDGQRLVAVSGAYGANGTQYRTERETYNKIVSYGAVGATGPSYFKVWTKSGQIIEYGNTPDSAIEAEGKSAIRVWAINKISDRKNNFLKVTYFEDNPNGEYYPLRIDYTGNDSSAPVLAATNYVYFQYEARPDISILYEAGSIVKSTVRLAHLLTHARVNNGDKLVKDYGFTYQLSASATNRSRLTAVVECDGETAQTCLRPTTLGWSDMQNLGTLEKSPAPFTLYERNWAGDFNGDGRSDVIAFNPLDRSKFVLSLSDGTGGFASKTIATSTMPCANIESMWRGDFDGDGRLDILGGCPIVVTGQPLTYDILVYFSNGDGTFSSRAPQLSGSKLNSYSTVVSDFNGDGRADVLTYWPTVPTSGIFQGTFTTFLSKGDGTFVKVSTPSPNNWVSLPGKSYFGDFNGDGKSDWMGQKSILDLNVGEYYPINPDQYSILFSNGDGTYTEKVVNFPTGQGDVQWAMDINGDGKTDGVGFIGQELTSYLSKGDGSFAIVRTGVATNFLWGCSQADMNHDGKVDMSISNAAGDKYILYSKGDGLFTQVLLSSSFGGAAQDFPYLIPSCVDYSGDGKADILILEQTGASYFYTPNQSVPDLLMDIRTGKGEHDTIEHLPLTNLSVYGKDSGVDAAAYPVMDVQAPLPVVSGITYGDGTGGSRAKRYKYFGAKSHVRGGGPLGFRKVDTTDVQTGHINSVLYGQGVSGSDPSCSVTTQLDSYPYCLFNTGLPLGTSHFLNSSGTLLDKVVNTWKFDTNTTYGPQYRAAKLDQSEHTSYELNGALVTRQTTNRTYDGFGNATTVAISSNDGYGTTTINTYQNNGANWVIGRLIRSEVTSTAPGTVPTITPTPGLASFSISVLSADKAEGNAGATPFTFTVARTGNANSAASVNWAVTGTGAHPANTDDFVGNVFPSGTLSFTAGQTSKVLTVNVQGNTIFGGDDEFTVTLSAPSNGSLGTLKATGVIRNDDTMPPPVISITALAADKLEGDTGTTPFTFTVSRSGMDLSMPSTVKYAVTGSGTTAANAADFVGGVLPAGTLTFAAGQTTQTLTVNVATNQTYEGDESFTVTFSNPTDATLGTATAFGTIRDEDTYIFNKTISANTLNYNLKTDAIAAGWNQVKGLVATVTINAGVYVGSSSTAGYAFDTGATFTAGTKLTLINNGTVMGAGGGGGVEGGSAGVQGGAGLPGGAAMRASIALKVTNNGTIGGGGGGGGGAAGGLFGGGGGGRGYNPGTGGSGQWVEFDNTSGKSGTQLVPGAGGGIGFLQVAGGSGGNLGQSGSVGSSYLDFSEGRWTYGGVGGAGGAAVVGNANVTWQVVGTRLGALQ